MSDFHESTSSTPLSLSAMGWGNEVVLVVCQNCDWRYLVKPGSITRECPHCHANALEDYESEDFSMLEDFIKPPEMVLPFNFPSDKLHEKLQNFAKNIPFAPDDLQSQNLQQRLKMVYLPMWLVDSDVAANWQAECGYYYQAKSHQEKFNNGQWHTQEVIETRTRWEERLGRLARQYQNITAPALEEHRQLMNALGSYTFNNAQQVSPEVILAGNSAAKPLVRVPTRDKDDAWPDTLPRFQDQAMQETKKACAADQIREFKWKPAFSNQNWTLFLLPMWSSFYLDDENKPQSILLNGQSGQMSGTRRASMKKAKKVSLSILIAALVIFALTVGLGLLSLMMEELMAFAIVSLVLSILVGLAAIYPIATVWNVNRDKG